MLGAGYWMLVPPLVLVLVVLLVLEREDRTRRAGCAGEGLSRDETCRPRSSRPPGQSLDGGIPPRSSCALAAAQRRRTRSPNMKVLSQICKSAEVQDVGLPAWLGTRHK